MLIFTILLFIIACALGYLLFTRQIRLGETKAELARLDAENQNLKAENLRMQAAADEAEERSRRQDELLETRLRLMAAEMLSSSSREFRESSEVRLTQLLAPLKEDIQSFRKSVSEAYSNESRERFSLRNELRSLSELNHQVSREASRLSNALEGNNRVQGQWGEMILERVLELSGLKQGVHYRVQSQVSSDGERFVNRTTGQLLRPDVIVDFPDKRCVVIDSKVSLSAYLELANAGDDAPAAADAVRRHVASIRRHISELSAKSYQDNVGVKRLDYVVMFIPNEAAYLAALDADPQLWEDAFSKRVLIASPTHVVAILRMLAQLWQQESVARNIEEIARLSGVMLDRFAAFAADIDKVCDQLDAVGETAKNARRRMFTGHGNLAATAQKIVTLGAKTSRATNIERLAAREGEEK